MKHIKSFLTISFLTMFILSSCKKDLKELSTYEGANFYYFTESSVEVLESTKEVVSIEVIYGTKDGAAGSVDFELSSTSATEGVDYKVLNATKSLSFDKDAAFKDVIMIEVIDNEVFTDAAAEITIELKNASNGVVGFDGPDKLRSTILLSILDDDCLTRNIAGSYTSTATGTSTDSCCPNSTTVEGEVTIVDNGEGNYAISDWSAGLYLEWFDVYGITQANVDGGVFTITASVLCDDLTASFVEPFDTDATIVGKVDLDSGVITYTWTNGFGDTADVILTLK